MTSYESIGKNVRSFIIRGIQCIVESRLSGAKVRTQCSDSSKSWFFIMLNEHPEVNECTTKCLQSLLDHSLNVSINTQLITSNWKICCEILLKTQDGESLTLEYWFISNQSLVGDGANYNNPNPSNTLFESYNKLSVLLKSIISLTRAMPAYKITQKQKSDLYVICYRVYKCDSSLEQLLGSEGKCASEELKCFTEQLRVGSVKTDYNVLTVSVASRIDMKCSKSNMQNVRSLSPSELLPVKADHFFSEKKLERKKEKPMFAAFGSTSTHDSISFPKLEDNAFTTLIPLNEQEEFSSLLNNMDEDKIKIKEKAELRTETQPIAIPEKGSNQSLRPKENKSLFSGSPGCSSLDSFVFVDLKPPFAPDDQNELGSFFNGPTPSFGGNSLAEEIEDITSQLEIMESNVQMWDEFVESISQKGNEELED